MFDQVIETDWRTVGSRGLSAWSRLLAGDGTLPPPLPDQVLRWLCQRCERHYVGVEPAPQFCPRCARPLAYVGTWSLRSERAPRWWHDRQALDPGELP
jgi:hypothetical protein